MPPALLPAILAFPLILALLLWPRATQGWALGLAPWAPLPALLYGVFGAADASVTIPWLLLGTELGLDGARRVFLLLFAGLWLVAGVSAAAYHRDDPARARLFAFHLVTLAGNLGLAVALDAASFYLFFILMSFAAFGLVIHDGTSEARRAAVVYLVLVIVGEVLILPGLWLAVSNAASLAFPDVAASVAELGWPVMLLLALGFAIKAGAVPLHVWLPLAHPVAPTPSSAVLSGAMIKAGALAWVVFLPMGLGAFPAFAWLFVAGGLLAAFYGAVVGIMQARPKTVLAYSSVSQMGFIMIAAGAALLGPAALEPALLALLAYTLHHGLSKGALFLGVGVVDYTADPAARRRALLLLLLPALALAGAPLTSGYVAKEALKAAGHGLQGLEPVFDMALPLAAVGTTLLMARFLWLMARRSPQGARAGLWAPWLALLGAVAVALWLPVGLAAEVRPGITLGGLWVALWPIGAGLALALVAASPAARARLSRLAVVPEGDLLWAAVALGRPLAGYRPRRALAAVGRARASLSARAASGLALWRAGVDRAGRVVTGWAFFGAASLAALLLMAALLARN